MKPKTAKQLEAAYRKKLDFIDSSLNDFDSDLKSLERELFDLLITDYVPLFTVVDGVIIQNERNLRLLAQLDKVMEQFKETFSTGTFTKLGENMLKMSGLTSDYFRLMTGGEKVIKNISDKLEKYRAAVGIDKSGNIIKGSFLDNLASTNDLKLKLSDYMQRAVTSEMDYRSFSRGLKDMVKGSAEKPGAMEKYVGNYAHDIFYQQARQQDAFFADEMGLDYFLWMGSEIKTSRPICQENHGRVFTREYLESLNETEWEGKIPGVDIFSQVGGYGCRHTLVPITEEAAKEIESEE